MARQLSQNESKLFIEYALRMTKSRIRLVSIGSAFLVVFAISVGFVLLMVLGD
ncbi:MAG: hypothetical protein ISS78_03780, partial [Phycisphaerae bacterium]|nr:hypothetical protein [Phycisphaerae bacterium]